MMSSTLSHRTPLEQDVGDSQMADIDAIMIMEAEARSDADGLSKVPEDEVVEDESAVDEAPYTLPSFLSAPSNRVRRRSELAFTRPSKLALDDHADRNAYELPSLPSGSDVRDAYNVGMGEKVVVSSSMTSPVPSTYHSESGAFVAHTSGGVQSPKQRMWGRIHFMALCWSFFLLGWNDGSTGPLLPIIQHHYNLGFGVVSLIFVLNTVGYIVGVASIVHLIDKLGFGWVVVIGSCCGVVTYAMQAPAGPFPLMIVSYGIAGFGSSLQNAAANGFVGSLKTNTAPLLGFLHGSYGLGAFSAPLAAVHFATAKHWSYHYLISLGIAVSNLVVLSAVFRFRTQDEVMAEAGHEPGEVGTEQGSKYRQILRLRTVHYLALFALIYVGVEVTLGGWIVTFVIRERHGGPSAGYISSGFFGGITVGRISLVWLNQKIGERRALFIYALICIGLEITIWAVPSLIENAVAVSLIGLLMGPMFPILVNHASKVFPRWLLTGAVGLITGVGMTGSAVLPLVTGLLASRFGISSLQPLVIAMMGVMTFVWAIVPKGQRRVD